MHARSTSARTLQNNWPSVKATHYPHCKSLHCSLLFAWLNELIDQRLRRDDDTFIGLFDLPGPQNMT